MFKRVKLVTYVLNKKVLHILKWTIREPLQPVKAIRSWARSATEHS